MHHHAVALYIAGDLVYFDDASGRRGKFLLVDGSSSISAHVGDVLVFISTPMVVDCDMHCRRFQPGNVMIFIRDS